MFKEGGEKYDYLYLWKVKWRIPRIDINDLVYFISSKSNHNIIKFNIRDAKLNFRV